MEGYPPTPELIDDAGRADRPPARRVPHLRRARRARPRPPRPTRPYDRRAAARRVARGGDGHLGDRDGGSGRELARGDCWPNGRYTAPPMAGERVKLQVQERDSRGSAESRRLRKQGLIPGVLYGRGKTPHPICIPERELRRVLTGGQGLHAILDVTLEGQKTTHPSILKEYQQHPVKGGIIHVDLQEVRLDQPIQARVVVELSGEPVGVTEGGVLSQVNREITVEALPMEIPEHLELDVSGMAIGDTLRLVDLPVQEGVEFLDDPEETVLATVTMPTRIVEPEPEVGRGARRGRAARGRGAGGRGGSRRGRGSRRGCRLGLRGRVRLDRRLGPDAPALAQGRARLFPRPARRRARQSGPRVRAQPPQRRLAGRRRARAPPRCARGARSSPARWRSCGSTTTASRC